MKSRKPVLPNLALKYRPELVVRTDGQYPHIAAPYVDAKAKKLVATNGYSLAVLPLTGRVKAAKRPKGLRPFPDWASVMPKYKAGDKGTVTVALDAHLLINLAHAIAAGGRDRQKLVVLTFDAPRNGSPHLAPILVTPGQLRSQPKNEAVGVLMPVRL